MADTYTYNVLKAFTVGEATYQDYTAYAVGDTIILTPAQAAQYPGMSSGPTPTLQLVAFSGAASNQPTGQDWSHDKAASAADVLAQCGAALTAFPASKSTGASGTDNIHTEVAGLNGDAMRGTDAGALAAVTALEATSTAILLDTGTTIPGTITTLQADTTAIKAVTDAIPVLTETGITITTTVLNTEYDVYLNNAPAGVYEPRTVTINCVNQTAGETLRVIVRKRNVLGGALTIQSDVSYAGAIIPNLLPISLGPNRFGIQVTIGRTRGVARAYVCETIYEE